MALAVNEVYRPCESLFPGLTIERLPLAYLEFDRNVRVLEWNPAAESTFGYTKREALGNSVLDLILPSPPSDHLHDILNRIWAGDFKAHSVNENLTKDGRVIECDWFNTPIFANGNVTGGISLARITASHQYPSFSENNLEPVSKHDHLLMDRLTPRQREVLQLVAEGNRTKQIARQLELSIKTIEMHRAGIMDALHIHNVPGLVRFAIRVGLVSART